LCVHRFQHLAIETEISYQPLQPQGPIFELMQALGLDHHQAAVHGFPRADRVLADPFSRATSSAVQPASPCSSAVIIFTSDCFLLLIPLAPQSEFILVDVRSQREQVTVTDS
jgi:hypothetical protein